MIDSMTVVWFRRTNDAAAVAVTTSFRPRDPAISIAVDRSREGTVPQLYRPRKGLVKSPNCRGPLAGQLCKLLIVRMLQPGQVAPVRNDGRQRHTIGDDGKDYCPDRRPKHVRPQERFEGMGKVPEVGP